MKEIPVSKGKYTVLVDDADYEWLSQFKWNYLSSGGYAVRYERKPDGRKRVIFMHKEILPAPKGMVSDHADGNPLNNQRANLRIASQKENCFNRRKRAITTCKYKGVFKLVLPSGNVRYRAECHIGRVGKHLGHFDTEEQAARAYDRRAWELFGEFARFNFPDEDPSKHPAVHQCRRHRYIDGKSCAKCGTERKAA